jgi:hypothetical protein
MMMKYPPTVIALSGMGCRHSIQIATKFPAHPADNRLIEVHYQEVRRRCAMGYLTYLIGCKGERDNANDAEYSEEVLLSGWNPDITLIRQQQKSEEATQMPSNQQQG